jgi:hypothetical protein
MEIDAKTIEQLGARIEDARSFLHIAEKTDELARLDSAVRSLEGYVKSEEEKLPKDVKIAKILLFAAALGISILMI